VPKVEQDILGAGSPLLLVDDGLLGRHDLMDRLQQIESTKERRRNGHPPNAPESYCRSGATSDNIPESRMSLPRRG
jgi:hypothetical protein